MLKNKKKITRINSNYMDHYDIYMQREQRKKQRLMRRLTLFGIVAFLLIGGLTTYHFKQRVVYGEMTEEYEKLEEDLASLKEEEKNFQEEIGLLNDDEYILEIARTNYFYSKKGELIFKTPDESPSY